MKQVDARGLACPQPLIATKKMIDSLTEESQIEVLLDDDIALGNVTEYLKQLGLSPKIEGYTITFTAKGSEAKSSSEQISCPTTPSKDYAVVIKSTTMGIGDDKLGTILLKAFVNTLPQTDNLPSHIVLYNQGVMCATKESGVIDALTELESKGVMIIICGTCVDFFGIKEQVSVGVISNMFRIIETLQSVSKVVYP